MGNEVGREIRNTQLATKMKDPETQAKIDACFRKDGVYTEYMRLWVQAEATCNHPLISLSTTLQDRCAVLRVQALVTKSRAYTESEGMAEYLERLGQK